MSTLAVGAWRNALEHTLEGFPLETREETVAVALAYICGAGYDAFGHGRNLSANEILERAVQWAEGQG